MKSVPFKPIEGVVQGLFSGDGRCVWVVYNDTAVVGRKHLNLTRLPTDAEVLDAMGNDPRRDGKKEWEIGIAPLFVMPGKVGTERLARMGQGAILY